MLVADKLEEILSDYFQIKQQGKPTENDCEHITVLREGDVVYWAPGFTEEKGLQPTMQ